MWLNVMNVMVAYIADVSSPSLQSKVKVNNLKRTKPKKVQIQIRCSCFLLNVVVSGKLAELDSCYP